MKLVSLVPRRRPAVGPRADISVRRLLCALAVTAGAALAWIGAGPWTRAEESGDPASLEFRRYLVPEAEISSQVLQGYMPIRSERFEEMIGQINSQATTAAGQNHVYLQRGFYTARLQGEELVDGQAQLEFVRLDRATRALVLAPCGVAISRPQWADDAGAPVNLGTDAAGQTVLLVDRDAPLQFAWTLRGQRDTSGVLTFVPRLPATPHSVLQLDLPPDVLPQVDKGLVEPAAGNDSSTVEDSTRRWRVQFVGGAADVLRIVPREVPVAQRRLVFVRQADRYHFAPAGLEYTVRLMLDVHHQPLEQLQLAIDPALSVVRARLGDQEVRAVAAQPSAGDAARLPVTLQLPQGILGTDREVVVTTFAPLVLDKIWQLPSLRPVDVVWQQGTAMLEVPQPLVLQRLLPKGAVETAVEPLPAPLQGESRSLLLSRTDTAVEVRLRRVTPQVQMATGTTLRIGPSQVVGRLAANMSLSVGTVFSLEAQIHRGWFIDRVTTVPADALDATAPWSVSGRRLRVRLRGGLRANHPVQLLISAHRSISLLPLNGSDLRILDLEHIQRNRAVISVCPDPPYHLQVVRSVDVPRFTAGELPPEVQLLVDCPANALAYEDSALANELLVGLNFEEPRYSATITTRASCDSQSLNQTYRIRIEPVGSTVGRVLVHFSQSSARDASWRLIADTGANLSARRLSEGESGLVGEAWELTLLRPRAEPFEVEAVRVGEFAATATLSLASLPEAASQIATLTVSSDDAVPLEIHGENVRAIPGEPPPDGSYARVRAVYRYDPARNAVVTVKRVGEKGSQQAAWVWDARLVSRYEPHGEASHLAVYHLENTGLNHVSLSLPAETLHWQVTVDNGELSADRAATTAQRLLVRLPRDVRFPTVRVRYVTPGHRLGAKGQVEAEWPSLGIPCLARTWSVWLPPSHRAVTPPDATAQLPLRWDERLFGCRLVRSESRPFNLFHAADWQGLEVDLDPPGFAADTARTFLQMVSVAGNELRQGKSRTPTWGELFDAVAQRAARVPARDRLAVWVDAPALRNAGIFARTAVDLSRNRTVPADSDLFADSSIGVVVAPRSVIVTDVNSLGRWSGTARPTAWRNVVTLATPQPLPASLTSAADWAVARPLAQSPWSYASETNALELPLTGWHNYELTVERTERGRLAVYQESSRALLGGLLLLGVFGATSWWLSSRPRWLAALVSVTAVLVLLCPVEWVPVARGVFLGAAFSWAFALVARVPYSFRRDATTEMAATVTYQHRGAMAVSQFMICLAALALHSSAILPAEEARAPATASPLQATGEEPAVPTSPADDTMGTTSVPAAPASAANGVPHPPFEVLSTVGEDGQPTGSYVFVPRAFYDLLLRHAAIPHNAPRGWLMLSASYQVGLGSPENGDATDDEVELTAEYDIEVFERGTPVALPLRREDASVLDATIDGQTVLPAWNEAGTALSFTVEEPRRARLRLLLRPRVRNREMATEFQLAIPPVVRSHVRIHSPVSLPRVEVEEARGGTQRSASGKEMDVELGPADRLAVRWNIPEAVGPETAEFDADRLLLLRVQPNSVTLDARFDLHVRRGALGQVELTVDPRLRLLPLPPDAAVVGHETQTTDVQRIRLQLNRPYSTDVSLRLSFLLSGVSGLGALIPPRIEVNSQSNGAAWLAVAVAPGLELQTPDTPADIVRNTASFAKLWGQVEPALRYAVQIPTERPTAPLVIQPLHPRTEARQAMDISVGLNLTTIQFRAALNMRDGVYLQQRLSIPEQFAVRDVQVSRDGVNRVQRWSDDGAGTLTVFFSVPLSGEHDLVLNGTLPGVATLPRISVQDAAVSDYPVGIYRRSTVNVAVVEPPGIQRVPRSLTQPYDPQWGRFVTAVQLAEDPAAAGKTALRVTPNRPNMRGQLTTSLEFRDQQWFVSTAFDLRISRGEFDSFRVVIADNVIGPFRLEPALPCELVPSLEPGRQTLLVRPLQPIQGQFQFRLSAALKNVPNEPVRAPEVWAPDVNDLRRYFVLPTRLGTQLIAWETSGLKAVDGPGEAAVPAQDASSQTVFQVVGQNPTAVVRDVDHSTETPQVHLADFHVTWQADGSYFGVAVFDLEPARLSDFEVVLPPRSRLIRSFVAELPMIAAPSGENRWRLAVGQEQWPQRVEVLYSGVVSPTANNVYSLPAPQLRGIPVRRTLWTIYGPPGAAGAQSQLADAAVDHRQQIRLRVETAEALAAFAPVAAARSAAKEATAWHETWRRHVADAQRELQEIDKPKRETTATASKWPDRASADPSARIDAVSYDPAQVLARIQNPAADPLRLAFRGGPTTVPVVYASAGNDPWRDRFGVAAGWIGLILGGCLLLRRPSVHEFVSRWPYLLTAAFGFLWWLLLSPSVVGLAILGLSAAAALRSPAGAAR